MSLITPGLGLIFWMVIIFGAVFFLLAKFGFPVITTMVAKRSDHIEESLRKADQAQAMLETMAEEQKAMLEQTKLEQSRLLKESAQMRDQIIAQAKEQAQKEADSIIAQAKDQISAEREAALRELSSQVSLLSVQIAEKIIRKDLSSDAEQMALIGRIIEEVSPSKQTRN